MRQVIICGRGGQGVMAAAEVLATALWSQGKFVQAFPSFQPEKKGAPTAAFVRYDNEEIWLRCEVDRADLVVVLDPAAILSMDIPHRLLPGGLLISNGSATDLSFADSLDLQSCHRQCNPNRRPPQARHPIDASGEYADAWCVCPSVRGCAFGSA